MNDNGFEVRDRLVADHEHLEKLLQQVISAFEADDREQVAAIWTGFHGELLKHLEAEERFLIPQLLRANQRAARAVLEEHRLIRSRLLELGASVDHHAIRLDTTRAFIDELRAHAKHEERVLYSWADQHVSEEDSRSLLALLLERAKPGVDAPER